MAPLSDERVETAVGAVQVLHGGAGEPVVYLHSAQGETSTGTGSAFLEQLADDFEVYAPVFPGFGESEGIDAIDDVEDAMFHVVDLLERLDLDRPALVGLSLGGWLAAEVAVYYPALLHRLVLVNPVGLYLPDAPIPDIFRGRGDALAELLFADQSHPVAQLMHAMAAGVEDPVVLASIPFEMVRPTLQGMAATAKIGWDPYLHDPKLARRLHRARVPALVVRGTADRLLAPEHAHRFVELLPDAELAEIDAAGHLLALERPAELADTVRAFLTRSRSRS